MAASKTVVAAFVEVVAVLVSGGPISFSSPDGRIGPDASDATLRSDESEALSNGMRNGLNNRA